MIIFVLGRDVWLEGWGSGYWGQSGHQGPKRRLLEGPDGHRSGQNIQHQILFSFNSII